MERVFAEHGIDYDGLQWPDAMPDDRELLEEVLYERLVEKGLA